jgi:transposase InsO family protein
VHADLAAQGVFVSRKRIVRIMQQEGLKGRVRRRYKCTTMSDHDQPVAANILDRNFDPVKPNECWAGDVTELLVGNGKLYFSAVLDLYSRLVIGWALSAVNDRWLVLRALDAALRRRRPGEGLIHHTDQGSPYASEDYQRVLAAHGITCSMSRRGNCYDNAVVESFFSTLKLELGERFPDPATTKRDVFDYIEVFYNRQRRHSSLGYLSPAEYERTRSGAVLAA